MIVAQVLRRRRNESPETGEPDLQRAPESATMAAIHQERLRDGPCDAAATSAIAPGANARSMREAVMDNVMELRCRECGRRFELEALHVCDWCFGPLEVSYDYERVAGTVSRDRIAAGPATIWRYRDLLPVADASPVDLGA